MRNLFIALALLAAAACQTVPETPAQSVFAAKSAFLATLKVANEYVSLPRCGPGAPAVCSDAEAVDLIRQAASSADATLDAAEATVRTPGIEKSALAFAVAAARNAVEALRAVLAHYTGEEA